MDGRTQQRTCGSKIKHMSKESALWHQEALSRRGRKAKQNQVQVYQCPFCQFWHVGHKYRPKDNIH